MLQHLCIKAYGSADIRAINNIEKVFYSVEWFSY